MNALTLSIADPPARNNDVAVPVTLPTCHNAAFASLASYATEDLPCGALAPILISPATFSVATFAISAAVTIRVPSLCDCGARGREPEYSNE